MKNSILKNKYFISLLSLIGLFLVFYLVYKTIDNPIIFPSPITSLQTFFTLLSKTKTYVIIGYTFLRLIISLLISFLIGASLGILAGRFVIIMHFLKPWMVIFRSTPLASIIVLLMIILGMDKSPYVICMLMLVPVIYEAFLNGILNLDKELMKVWRLDTKFNARILGCVILPMSKPFIKTAFSQSVGLGIKVLVMAEFICYTPNSIGKALGQAANNLEYDLVFAWSILAILLVICIDFFPKIINKLLVKDKTNSYNGIR